MSVGSVRAVLVPAPARSTSPGDKLTQRHPTLQDGSHLRPFILGQEKLLLLTVLRTWGRLRMSQVG